MASVQQERIRGHEVMTDKWKELFCIRWLLTRKMLYALEQGKNVSEYLQILDKLE